jgi:hypothetical protein
MDSHRKLSSWPKQDIKETIEMERKILKTNILGQCKQKTIV